MKRVAVVTSGGDAPGMNAAVRAIVRVGIDLGLEAFGVRQGYAGLIEADITRLSLRDVSGIMQLGGTFLGTARSEKFKQTRFQKKCIENLNKKGIEGLIVIGGSGSQKGAYALGKLGFPVAGIASTVDNDLYGSDISIGVDTALNTILESIDKIKTTAQSHHRAFLVEVMGRRYGYLALMSALAGGAEIVVTPEFEIEAETVARELKEAYLKGKKFALVIVSEGAKNNAEKFFHYFKKHGEKMGYELRITILGHVQRGGAPTAFDRLLASRLGAAAIQLLSQGKSGQLVGWKKGQVAYTLLEEVVSKKKSLDADMWQLGQILAK